MVNTDSRRNTVMSYSRYEYDTDRAFDDCMKENRAWILDAIEQGDTIDQIVDALGGGSIARQVVEEVIEETKDEATMDTPT